VGSRSGILHCTGTYLMKTDGLRNTLCPPGEDHLGDQGQLQTISSDIDEGVAVGRGEGGHQPQFNP